MELSEVIRRRRMVRNYDPDRPVPAEVADKLLQYAVHAPSAGVVASLPVHPGAEVDTGELLAVLDPE